MSGNTSCGAISLTGGTITAISGSSALTAIGIGVGISSCTSISIGSGVTSLTTQNTNNDAENIVSSFINASDVTVAGESAMTYLSHPVTTVNTVLLTSGKFTTATYDSANKTWTIAK